MRKMSLPLTDRIPGPAWLLAPLLAALFAVLLPPSVSANGAHAAPVEIYSGSVGPYAIWVEATPIVGTLHLTAYVFKASTHESVTDATVGAFGRRIDGGAQAGPVTGTYLADADAYPLSFLVEEAGDWMFTVVVTSALGEETVEVPVLVRDPSGVNLTVVGMAAVLAALVIWFTGKAFRQRRTGEGTPPRSIGRGRR